MIELRPYQNEALEAIENFETEGIHRQLVSLPTGTGKTILFSTAAKRRNGRTLILAHRDELIQQAVDKLMMVWDGVSVGVVKAERNETDKQIIVGSVQTVSRENRLEQLPKDFDFIVSDEAHHCHIPGTQVLTAYGNKAIESLKVGQRVYGFDGDSWELYQIVNTFKYRYDGLIYDIVMENRNTVSVTPNHQLYAKGRKIYASQIQRGESLSVSTMQLDDNKSSGYSTTSAMASLWQKALSQMLRYFRQSGNASAFRKAQKRESVMSLLWRTVCERFNRRSYQCCAYQQRDVLSRSTKTSNEYTPSKQGVSLLSFPTDEKKESDVKERSQRQNDEHDSPNGRKRRVSSLRKLGDLWKWWDTNKSRGIHFNAIPKRALSACGSSFGWNTPIPLQDRLCVPFAKDRIGDRRSVTRESSRCGQKEGCSFEYVGLDDYSCEKRRSAIREERVSAVRVRHYTGWVYDIEVEIVHNYVANGVLSSNSAAATYQRIYKYLGVMAEEDEELQTDTLHLGVTATPQRTDKIGLDDVFDKIVFHRNIQDFIPDYLCDLRCVQVMTYINIDGVETWAGDLRTEQLSALLNTTNCNELIVEAWKEHALGRLTLCFTTDVAHARDLCMTFRAYDIKAEWLCGETPIDERRDILARFAQGEIEVLTNCAVLTEGYDNPALDCIIIARPTKSKLLYTQMVGRGTRTYPQKQDCLILDVACVSTEHDLVSFPSLFGLDKEQTGEQTLTEQLAEKEKKLPIFEGIGTESREVELFGKKQGSDAYSMSNLAWIQLRNGFRLNLAGDGIINVYTDFKDPTLYRVFYRSRKEKRQITGRPVDLSLAFGLAESEARQVTCGNLVLVDRSAPWRQYPASDKQLAKLSAFGIYRTDLTKGEASDLLAQIFAEQYSK